MLERRPSLHLIASLLPSHSLFRTWECAMEAGSCAFPSATFENHNGYAGGPRPSRLADDEEFETLIGVLGEKGRGLFMITVGQRTTVGTLAGYARRTGR